MYIQTKSKKKRTSEVLAIIAMVLLLTYISDAAIAHGNNKQGFLPMNAAQRGMIFGTSSIILFLLSFAIGFGEKSKITTALLIAGGALIGTSVLASSIMAKAGLAGIQNSFVIVIIIGYVIMGLGIFRAVQKK